MAIGQSIPMLDARARVTGAVEYMVNFKRPNLLFGKIVRSYLPHARVVKIDASKANQVAGVRAILTREDLGTSGIYGLRVKDQGIVAIERVRFVGDPVAAVAAENIEAAEEAASLIEVEYEELPAVFDSLEAIKPGAPVLHEKFPNNILAHAKLRHGDIAAGFAQADEIFEDTFASPAAQHASLEAHATVAQWDGDKLTVWTGAQAPYAIRQVLSGIFGIPPENVRVIVPPLGGGYGGKGGVRIEPIVAALARKTNGRPVKIVLSRAEEFVTVTKHAAVLTLKTGVTRDGTFTARQVTIHWNGGAYADATPNLVSSGMVRALGPYRIPNAWVDSYGVYTNLPPAGAYRGAMSSQTTWAYESQMDMIAKRMGWDALEFRMKNMLRTGDTFATGETLHGIYFAECLESVVRALPDTGTRGSDDTATVKRGRGIAVMMKSTMAASKSQARLELTADGMLTLFTSTVEMGQGAHTTMAQITAEAVGMPVRNVRVVGPDTAVTPYDASTSGARSTSMMGAAIFAAARDLRSKLAGLAAPVLETAAEELKIENGNVRSSNEQVSFTEVLKRNNLESLGAFGEHETKFGIDSETGQGISTPHWHQGAGAVEVEVDTETGKVTILRYASSSFAGRVVNPRLAELQNDGNVIFGLGPTLMEEMVFSNGQVYNQNLSDYSIPSFRDIPTEMSDECIVSEDGELHGIGEMTLPPVAPAVANAIENAIGVRITDLPITPEKVLRAIKGNS